MTDDTGNVANTSAGWPLVKVLDVGALVLGAAVIARAIGALVSALGFPGVHINFGAPSGLPVSTLNLFSVPTSLRLQYGTEWADLASGIVLAAGLSLLALPRMLWDVPASEEWSGVAPKALIGVLAVAFLATSASAIGIVNEIWHADQTSQSITEALNVGAGVAAAVLSGAVAVLCWFALPYVRAPHTTDQPIPRSPIDRTPDT
jgi:hypothetical protein